MSDDNKKASEPVPQKEEPKKAKEADANPKKHGSEAGGAPGEGRTGTGLGSTDS
jgi:hypothetical protein